MGSVHLSPPSPVLTPQLPNSLAYPLRERLPAHTAVAFALFLVLPSRYVRYTKETSRLGIETSHKVRYEEVIFCTCTNAGKHAASYVKTPV